MAKNKNTFNPFIAASFIGQLGFSVAIPLVLGIGGGVWLDRYFGTSPTLTLGGVALGLFLAGVSFYKEVREYLGHE